MRAAGRAASWIGWADLKRRVFGQDELTCGKCGGRMEVIALMRSRAGLARFLGALGLETEPPRMAPARDPPQGELWPGGEADAS
jgi:hypothetical protein